MSDQFVTIREFEGLSKRLDERFGQVIDGTASLHGKFDTLLLKSVEEARVVGEISGKISAMMERLDRQERETILLRERQEKEAEAFQEQISELRERHVRESDGKVNWFMQLAMLIIAAIVGGIITKAWK